MRPEGRVCVSRDREGESGLHNGEGFEAKKEREGKKQFEGRKRSVEGSIKSLWLQWEDINTDLKSSGKKPESGRPESHITELDTGRAMGRH